MKRIIVFILTGPLLIAGCKGKYNDVKDNIEKTMEETRIHCDEFKRIENAEDLVKAYNNYIDGIKPLVMEWYKLEKKYPELQGIFIDKKKERPPELKDILDELDKLNAQWGQLSLYTFRKYIGNKSVMKVMERSRELFPPKK